MKLGVIADDFTGASDIALTLAEGGMQVAQVTGPIADFDTDGLDAVVVSLKSRTCPVEDAIAMSLDACDWLLARGAEQIVFKVCSTFDSTDDGNIGPVLDALAARLEARQTLVCPAFPENGRSVYQGHLFVGDKLLNESGMQYHPLTPMTDPDLRRVLARQSDVSVSHVPHGSVLAGLDKILSDMDGKGHFIVDAITDQDLLVIGQASRDLRLICGGSGIALGLPANHGMTARAPSWPAISGPAAVLSGSCSGMTRQQVVRYCEDAPNTMISADAILNAETTPDNVADWVLAQDTAPLVYSSADPESVSETQMRYGRERVAAAFDDFFAKLAVALVGQGVTRIVVAGGETSGAVVSGLQVQTMRIGPRAAAGVPLLLVEGETGVALALKSGNFGGPDFFRTTLDLMETRVD